MTVSAPVRDLLQLALGSFPRSQEEKDRSRALLRCAYRGRTRKVRLSIVENCGGPGSGKPGPCPSGRRSDEEIAKAFGVTERGTSKPAGVKPTGQLILKKHGDRYRIVDGFGRTNGMLNAGKKRIRAVVVSDRDLSFRTVTGDDESWNRKVYRKYFPNLQYHATTNARPIKTDIRIKELAPYLHDLLGDVTKRDAKAIARIVKRGVERRWKDSSVARAIVRSTKIEPDRARVIARTEMSRARTDVGLGKKRDSDKVVFTLGAVDRTCPKCRALEGKVYTVRKAAGVIPIHPSCRCYWSDAPKGARVSNVFCATTTAIENFNANCGGPGSGKPGPCPSGRRSEEDITKSFGVTERGTSKPAGVKPTGQVKGKVGYVAISKIDLQGERLEEIEPLASNDDKPVILKKHGDGYRIVDGFGRTNGMINAGNKRIRAVVVSDRDLSFRTVTGDDESWNRKIYRKYFPGLRYHATTN